MTEISQPEGKMTRRDFLRTTGLVVGAVGLELALNSCGTEAEKRLTERLFAQGVSFTKPEINTGGKKSIPAISLTQAELDDARHNFNNGNFPSYNLLPDDFYHLTTSSPGFHIGGTGGVPGINLPGSSSTKETDPVRQFIIARYFDPDPTKMMDLHVALTKEVPSTQVWVTEAQDGSSGSYGHTLYLNMKMDQPHSDVGLLISYTG